MSFYRTPGYWAQRDDRPSVKAKPLKLGSFVCDMHYGVPPAKATNHTTIRTRAAHEMVQAMLDKLDLDDDRKLNNTNKYAYVVGETSDGDALCAYSYDSLVFGTFEYPIGN